MCATGEASLGILETNRPNGTLTPHPVTARGFLVQADCLADGEAQIQQGTRYKRPASKLPLFGKSGANLVERPGFL